MGFTKYENGHMIFFVDDEPSVRQAVAAALQRSHLGVACFESAGDCLENLRSQRCDLVIADLRMPEMDGIELTREIRNRTPWIPVLILTGYGNVPTAVEAVRAGAIDFVGKPLDKDGFIRKVKSILHNNGNGADAPCGSSLTASETRVLRLILDGRRNREIADLLNRSQRTIEVHRARIMQKLGAKNTIDLVKRSIEMGLA